MKRNVILGFFALSATLFLTAYGGGVKDKGSNDYKTVKIGSQEWMAENLNASTFRNGDPIPQAKTEEEWTKAGEEGKPAWCYYENDPANGNIYGKFYNWHAVNDLRGLAPEGWHVPTDEEWTTLTESLNGTREAGGKLKEAGTAHWNSPNEGATNETGFTALPGGSRYYNGKFSGIGEYGGWWCASGYGTSNSAWLRGLGYGHSGVFRQISFMMDGLSVRCIRD